MDTSPPALGDFGENEEQDIGESELNLDELEEMVDGPPAKKTFAKVVSKPKVRGYEVLYVHKGTTEREPIPKETFRKLYDRINSHVLEKILAGQAVPDGILWRSWKDGRGLIAVDDKETSEFVCKLVGETQI